MPSIKHNAKIKLRVDSFCRIRAVGSACLKIYTCMASYLLFWACKMAFLRSDQQMLFPLCLEDSNKWLYTY